jgi:hypothetical protein
VLPVERGRRTFRVVLVIGSGRGRRRRHYALEVPLQGIEPGLSLIALRGEPVARGR